MLSGLDRHGLHPPQWTYFNFQFEVAQMPVGSISPGQCGLRFNYYWPLRQSTAKQSQARESDLVPQRTDADCNVWHRCFYCPPDRATQQSESLAGVRCIENTAKEQPVNEPENKRLTETGQGLAGNEKSGMSKVWRAMVIVLAVVGALALIAVGGMFWMHGSMMGGMGGMGGMGMGMGR